jgi:hypothetical protein
MILPAECKIFFAAALLHLYNRLKQQRNEIFYRLSACDTIDLRENLC